ncbi:cobalamin-dependent protein [Pseudomonas sp. PDM09]|uniref:cobalamin-dependent protein n=1 Tax=Pseudomonas sp. PDM09 TaxID=2769270 RepID=UPI00298D468B|nr:cobalamin-dependent protein [Pseudomonas sp. PDM09]
MAPNRPALQHLGLPSLKSSRSGIRRRANCPLVAVDQGHLIRYGLTDAQMRKIIEDAQPDIVGIQCNYTVQWGNARALADLVKSIDPDLLLVTGGAHSSGDWQNVLLDSPFDFTLINEADRAFTLLLDALTHDAGNVDAVPGIAYRNYSGQLVRPTRKSSYLSIVPARQDLEERDSGHRWVHARFRQPACFGR